jgi:hypothetical protein
MLPGENMGFNSPQHGLPVSLNKPRGRRSLGSETASPSHGTRRGNLQLTFP